MKVPQVNKAHQQGVALLTILIMVALATILAMSILRYQQSNLEETKMLLRQDQALQYAHSAEYFFSELLIQDAKDNNTDDLNENWAKPFPFFPVQDDGMVSGQIIDNHRKFNLNSLLNPKGDANEAGVAFFKAILKKLNLDENLVEAVIDWQDADHETVGPMGAENSYYQGLKEGYMAPNAMFGSIEQLQQVRGFEPRVYEAIKPFVTVLPSRSTKMNVNTVDPLLLSCLSAQLDSFVITNELQQKRESLEVFDGFAQIWQMPAFAGVPAGDRSTFESLFDIKSSFFVADIQVDLSDRKRTLRTWLYRDGQTVQSYQKSWVVMP